MQRRGDGYTYFLLCDGVRLCGCARGDNILMRFLRFSRGRTKISRSFSSIKICPACYCSMASAPRRKKQRTDNCSAVEFEDSSPVDCPKFDKISDPTFKIHHFSFTHRIKSKVRVSKCCKSARQRLFRRNAISYKKIA